MERLTIKIGEREIPLALTALELVTIQEDLGCTILQVRDEVFGIKQDFEKIDPKTGNPKTTLEILRDPKRVKKLATLIRIMGNAGLEEEGKEPDLTDRWILRHMSPATEMILAYSVAMQTAINVMMSVEIPAEEEGAVDLVLEEEKRKKEHGN